ncbi:hypothetical protein IGI04_007777, partial [Brassica rapa subsp. trilocularis]
TNIYSTFCGLYDARGRHIVDVSRTSGVSETGTARGRCGDVSETFQRGWGRQRFLGTAWLGFGNVSETFRMYSRHNFVKVMTSQGASDNVDNASEEAPLWNYVTKLEKSGAKGGTWKFKCNICNEDRQGSYSRIRAHLLGIKNQGIAICKKATRSQKSDMQKLEDEFEKKKNE